MVWLRRKKKTNDPMKAAWTSGLPAEVQFWEDFIRTRGLDWPHDFRDRLNPDLPFPPHLRARLVPEPPPGSVIRVLDVGSGPLTTLGTRWEGRTVELVPIDPLADRYNELLDQAGITPPNRTRHGEAERLTEYFPEGHFDLAHAVNSLDHSYNPLESIRQMLLVVKPGAYVQLEHAADEAETQKYDGLHQWNFRIESGRLVIWRPGERLDVGAELGGLVSVVSINNAHPTWVSAGLRRA